MSELVLKEVEVLSEKIRFDVVDSGGVYKVVGKHSNGFRSFSYANCKLRICKCKTDITNKFILDTYHKEVSKKGGSFVK